MPIITTLARPHAVAIGRTVRIVDDAAKIEQFPIIAFDNERAVRELHRQLTTIIEFWDVVR